MVSQTILKTETSCSAARVLQNDLNTLAFEPEKCINCGMCLLVCPHAVFAEGLKTVTLANYEACMECGACQMNCPTGAIIVDSGVGCATAMIYAALKGLDEPICGDDDNSCCE